MIKINYTGRTKSNGEIIIGTTFLGTISTYSGLFLKTYAGIVLLDNPCVTFVKDNNLLVETYREVNLTVNVEHL